MTAHSSHIGREARVAWAIAAKDMRTYYTRPPSLMFGILFPFSLFLSFSIGRNAPIATQIPILIAQTLGGETFFGPLMNITVLAAYTALFLFMGIRFHTMNQKKE